MLSKLNNSINLFLGIITFICSVFLLSSCDKESNLSPLSSLEEPLEIRDSTDLSRPQINSYYLDLSSITEGNWDTLTGASLNNNYTLVRVIDDSTNNRDLVQYHQFTTKSAYLNYADGTLGLDEAEAFDKEEEILKYLADIGKTVSDTMTFTEAQTTEINSIMNLAPAFPISKFFEHKDFVNLIFTWNAGKIFHFLDANNRISSYRTERMSFATKDKFYNLGGYLGKIVTFDIPKRSTGAPFVFEVADFGKIPKLNDRATSWTKEPK